MLLPGPQDDESIREACVRAPAGLIVRIRDDDELRVGNDGRPLLLAYVLGNHQQHKNST